MLWNKNVDALYLNFLYLHVYKLEVTLRKGLWLTTQFNSIADKK